MTIPTLTQMYETWLGTVHNPTEAQIFEGGFVTGAWSMRERILLLDAVKNNPLLMSAIEDVLDIPK